MDWLLLCKVLAKLLRLAMRLGTTCTLIGLVLGVSTGCHSTHAVIPGTPNGARQRIEAMSQKHTATIHLREGQTFKARNLHLTPDSLITPTGRYALHEVEWIRFQRRGPALVKGMLVGLVAGLGPPVLLLSNSECTGLGCALVPAIAALVAAYTVPIGIVGGGLIGYLRSDVTTYRIQTPRADLPPKSGS